MVLVKAEDKQIEEIVSMSKRAFDSDFEVGGSPCGGPPGYDSPAWHEEMLMKGHLFVALEENHIVGGAVLFLHGNGKDLSVGRIFIDCRYHRKGYGTALMGCVEDYFPAAGRFHLDTPIWNKRTNAFYRKLGYVEKKRDDEFVYYQKCRGDKRSQDHFPH